MEEDIRENGEPAFHASCPALKGCHTWGHTYDEALANIREAIELSVKDILESGGTVHKEELLRPMVRSL